MNVRKTPEITVVFSEQVTDEEQALIEGGTLAGLRSALRTGLPLKY
jgi:hypothetical protein